VVAVLSGTSVKKASITIVFVGTARVVAATENLLLDDKGNLKISDFGLSAMYTSEGTTRATVRRVKRPLQ
jgi:serine/threonine protein kinase